MALKFYMDVHVKGAITKGLRIRGVDVLTAQEDGMDRASDSDILQRAHELKRIIFTSDDDFLVEAHNRQQEGVAFSGVIFIQQKKISIGCCIDDLELIAEVATYKEMVNDVKYLPL